jgi:hypothetical protein
VLGVCGGAPCLAPRGAPNRLSGCFCSVNSQNDCLEWIVFAFCLAKTFESGRARGPRSLRKSGGRAWVAGSLGVRGRLGFSTFPSNPSGGGLGSLRLSTEAGDLRTLGGLSTPERRSRNTSPRLLRMRPLARAVHASGIPTRATCFATSRNARAAVGRSRIERRRGVPEDVARCELARAARTVAVGG